MSGIAPFVRESVTSREAAVAITPKRASLRAKIVNFIGLRQHLGCTCDEIEKWLGLLHTTASARIREAVLAGELKPSGEQRKTRWGRNAVVYVRAV